MVRKQREQRELVRTTSSAGDRTSRHLARASSVASSAAPRSSRPRDRDRLLAVAEPIVAGEDRSSDTDNSVVSSADGGSLSASFVRKLLAEHSSRMAAQLDSGLLAARNQMQSALDQNLSSTLSQLDLSYQRRFSGIERVVDLQEQRIECLRAELKEQRERTEKLEEAIYKPFTKLETELADDDFVRAVNGCLLRARTLSNVAIESIKKSLEPTLAAMSLPPGEVFVGGGTPGRSFEISFSGSELVQQARCKKSLSLQRLPDRTFRKVEAVDSAGAVTAVFVEPDKNRQTIKSELLSRKARRILETITGQTFSVRKSDFTVFQGPLPVLRIRDVTSASHRVEWNRDWQEANPTVVPGCLRELDELFADRASRASWR